MAAASPRGLRGGPLLLAVAGGAVLLALLSVFLVSWVAMKKRAAIESCLLNLKLIAVEMGRCELYGMREWDAAGSGRAFLANHPSWPSKTPPRPIPLSCPVRNVPGEIDYRGPALSLRQSKDMDPLCADRPGNHGPEGGGNVMLKTGQVFHAGERDPLWLRAAETTKD